MELPSSTVATKLDNLIRSDFWFQDGNIVIITGPAAFKVHRGQLARHSEVFSDLFAIPQPKDQELFEGCFWVELYDCPSDVFYFLRALYDGLYFAQHRASDFPAIAAVLRLSTKYLVEHLRQRCLDRLEHDWPSTLFGWDQREHEATDSSGRYDPRVSCAHPILVIDLAVELGLYAFLPAAFYDLSRYGPSKIISGTVSAPLVIPLPAEDSTPGDSIVHLSDDFLCRTFLGRESAQRYIAAFIERELNARPVSANCVNLDEQEGRLCRESFYYIMLNILRSVSGIACGRDADALFTLLQAIGMLSRTDFSDGQKQCGLKICDTCKADFVASVNDARADVWERVPGWFGLGSSPNSSPRYE